MVSCTRDTIRFCPYLVHDNSLLLLHFVVHRCKESYHTILTILFVMTFKGHRLLNDSHQFIRLHHLSHLLYYGVPALTSDTNNLPTKQSKTMNNCKIYKIAFNKSNTPFKINPTPRPNMLITVFISSLLEIIHCCIRQIILYNTLCVFLRRYMSLLIHIIWIGNYHT